LLAAEPDLARFLTDDECDAVARVTLPVCRLPTGELSIDALLREADAFGALVLDGMVLHRLRIGERAAMRLVGPGDLLSLAGRTPSPLVAQAGWTTAAETRLALFGSDLLLAVRRYPRLMAGLHVRLAEQSDRVGTQLAICQLPRVSDRLLGLMWLLAESWGKVTPMGVTLPLGLTHDALGALVGARRSTVTLALGELAERGAVVRQDRGWLLLEDLTAPARDPGLAEIPALLGRPASAWSPDDAPAPDQARPFPELLATVEQLRTEHPARREDIRRHLEQARAARERVAERRARFALTPPRAPSS
jgi:CRP-like cAMP-binding protein